MKTETSPKKSPAKANFPKKQAGRTPKTNDKMKRTDAKKRLEIAAPHPPRLHPQKRVATKSLPRERERRSLESSRPTKRSVEKRRVVTVHMLEGTDRSVSLVQEKVRLLRWILTVMMIRWIWVMKKNMLSHWLK